MVFYQDYKEWSTRSLIYKKEKRVVGEPFSTVPTLSVQDLPFKFTTKLLAASQHIFNTFLFGCPVQLSTFSQITYVSSL